MIDLRDYSEAVATFISSGLQHFRAEHPDFPLNQIGVYCCPWSGWLSLCVASNAELDNCPDFDFVEYALFESPAWEREYEDAQVSTYATLDGRTLTTDPDGGDEPLNRIFLDFLVALLRSSALSDALPPGTRLRVQLLDSRCNDSWIVD